MLRSHLTVLESSAARYPSSPVFKVPQLDSQGSIEGWESITYQRFRGDVESYARYWAGVFKRDRIPQRSVIGIWCVDKCIAAIRSRLIQIFRVSGFTYTDVLHIYGISRAGYIPQLFSLRLPNPEVIYELLHRANAQALVCAQTFESVLQGSSVPVHPAVFGASASDDSSVKLPNLSLAQGSDIAFIFHTSGSTSGSPKLVPCNYQWLNTVVDKSSQICSPRNPSSRQQDVTVMMFVCCRSCNRKMNSHHF
jgi:acyl-CoA synthetase (AMP-forming)/AMP-acid ligase II